MGYQKSWWLHPTFTTPLGITQSAPPSRRVEDPWVVSTQPGLCKGGTAPSGPAFFSIPSGKRLHNYKEITIFNG